MEVITREIDCALDAGLYYAALVCSLTVPDICSALEAPKGETAGSLYKKWCVTWLESHPSLVRGLFPTSYPKGISNDLYYLRCGVVHQGRLEHGKSQFSRIAFTLPNTENTAAHLNVVGGVLNLDLLTFCRDMTNAASRWFEAKHSDTYVKANLPRLIQYREEVLAPYIAGVSGFA